MVQTNRVKKKILVIGGPTAVGKSDFAVECALRFNGVVISADSMQIYRGLDIGTGKITEAEKRGVEHRLLDILRPNERYSVGQYLYDVKAEIDSVHCLNRLPIVVGGTALYINALLNGMNLTDATRSDEVREKWKKRASECGNDYIYSELLKVDKASAEKISPNDVKRVIRALEIFEVTGRPKSESATVSECDYEYRFIVISDEREKLYNRINKRVDKMIALGLENEAHSLMEYRDCQSMQAIGYKQFIDYFDGKNACFEQTVDEIKKLSRNYAKRQLTFFRGMNAENKNWITPDDFDAEYARIAEFLEWSE